MAHQPTPNQQTGDTFIVQVNTGNGWRKVRGIGGPYSLQSRAEKLAAARAPGDGWSTSEGYPHRVVRIDAKGRRHVVTRLQEGNQ